MAESEGYVVRPAEAGDFAAIQAIFAAEVLHGTASFEADPPSVGEMRARWLRLTATPGQELFLQSYCISAIPDGQMPEPTTPGMEEVERRRRPKPSSGYPYLVCVADGMLAGYASAGPYRARPAYRFTVENSVYVAATARGRGIGKRLLAALIDACGAAGYRQMIAVIGDSAQVASIRLHESLGFRRIGTLPDVGYKFDRWLDTVIMQRALGVAGKQ